MHFRANARIVVFLLITGFYWNSLAEAQTVCRDPRWIRRIAAELDTADAATIQQARQWLERWRTIDDERIARGMLRTLLSKDLKAISVSFNNLHPGDMPFLPNATNLTDQLDEMYRVIGELTMPDPDLTMMPGLNRRIGSIVSSERSNQIGAILDLKVADDIGLADSLGALDAGFEVQFTGSGALQPDNILSRNMDIFDPVTGFAHESKNWPNGLPGEEGSVVREKALNDFMDEFRRDIIIHGTNGQNFSTYRLNFREATIPHLDFLKTLLDEQFASSFVTSRVPGEELIAIKQAFDDLWRARESDSLLRFFP